MFNRNRIILVIIATIVGCVVNVEKLKDIRVKIGVFVIVLYSSYWILNHYDVIEAMDSEEVIGVAERNFFDSADQTGDFTECTDTESCPWYLRVLDYKCRKWGDMTDQNGGDSKHHSSKKKYCQRDRSELDWRCGGSYSDCESFSSKGRDWKLWCSVPTKPAGAHAICELCTPETCDNQV